jgi:TRAP-type C4-dicarboxylate transport system permease small subunit
MSDGDLGTEPTRGEVGLPVFLSGALRGLVALVVFAMMALIFVDVFMRYLFSAPIPGGFEIVQFMLALLIFTALPLVTWAEGHIVVSIFEKFFVGKRGVVQKVGVLIVSIASLLLIAFLMWRQALSLHASQQITGFLEWPIFPIAYVMCALTLIAVGIQVAMLVHYLRYKVGRGAGNRTDEGARR